MVEEGGFEPPNPKELIYSQPRLAASLLLHDRLAYEWWMLRGLNPRPPPCKGDALPAELNIRDRRYMLYKYIIVKNDSQPKIVEN